MKLGFLLFEYFPHGGLQRDCLRTAELCAKRGHAVTIHTRAWEGPQPAGVEVRSYGTGGLSNVSRNRRWLDAVTAERAQVPCDGWVGFNKLPGLDVYFGADPCYVAKMARLRGGWYRWTPRYRYFRAMEEAVFAHGRSTHVLLLTEREVGVYRGIYGTERERMHVLPPGIARREFTRAAQDTARASVRHGQGWGAEALVILFVGSGFRVKGLDRAIAAVAALPEAMRRRVQLVVIGRGSPGAFWAQARRLGVGDQVHFLGARDDVPEWMLGADVLVHPAHSESGGMVLLEALTCGLPVLTTDACGYAFHVERAGAGHVLRTPFQQAQCNAVLAEMLQGLTRPQWSANGVAYAAREDLYSCHEQAVAWIERILGATR